MTIIIAGRWGGFGILAADRLVSGYTTRAPELRRKVHVHPTLPVAVAGSGLATIVDPQDWLAVINVDDLLEDLLPSKVRVPCSAMSVADQLAHFLHPLFLPVILKHSIPEGQQPKLWVVSAHDGTVSSTRLEIGEQVAPAAPLAEGDFAAHWCSSDRTMPLLKKFTPSFLSCMGGPTGLAVSTIRGAMETAITLEEMFEPPPSIGGPVDVALVEANGARFV